MLVSGYDPNWRPSLAVAVPAKNTTWWKARPPMKERRFGTWTVLSTVGDRTRRRHNLLCDCGATRTASEGHLTSVGAVLCHACGRGKERRP
jgi:hypothetical protein